MAGYDISAAVSESSTTASSAGAGAFTVGGGGKASWVWPLALVGALFVWLWFRQNK